MMMKMMTMMITTCLGCYFQPLSQGARNGPECATNFGGGGGDFATNLKNEIAPQKFPLPKYPPL